MVFIVWPNICIPLSDVLGGERLPIRLPTQDKPYNTVQSYSLSKDALFFISWCGTRDDASQARLCCYGGAYVISNQNPRWTHKPCVPLDLSTIFGSQYYVIFPRSSWAKPEVRAARPKILNAPGTKFFGFFFGTSYQRTQWLTTVTNSPHLGEIVWSLWSIPTFII